MSHEHHGHSHSHGHRHSHGHGHSHGAGEGKTGDGAVDYAEQNANFNSGEYARMTETVPEWQAMVDAQRAFVAAQEWWSAESSKTYKTLDFGCGTGRLLCGMGARLGAGSVGLDPAAGMLTVAREHAVEDGLTSVVTFDSIDPAKDGAELDSFADSFDLVLNVLVLHHLSKPKAIVERLIKALAPGGRIFIVERADGFSLDQLKSLFAAAGIEVTAEMTRDFDIPPFNGNPATTMTAYHVLGQKAV